MALKNKSMVQIIRVVIGCVAIITSPYIYAGVVHVPVIIKCSSNLMESPWVVFDGAPGTQYTITTKGLRDNEIGEEVVEVTNDGLVEKTSYGLPAYVEAKCIPSNEATNISLTNSFLTCNKGEGIKVNMFMPNSSNPNRYHYVGMLTIALDEKKESDFITTLDSEDELLQAKIKKTKLDISGIKSKCYDFVSNFGDF